jgi:hypothetical protein
LTIGRLRAIHYTSIETNSVHAEGKVLKASARVLAIGLIAGGSAVGQDDFPISGTYTENRACAGADNSVVRVRITPRDIDSPVLGLCTILEKKREGDKFSVHVECKGAGGASMMGDVTFTQKGDGTLDFADQDNTYKAVLHKCPG